MSSTFYIAMVNGTCISSPDLDVVLVRESYSNIKNNTNNLVLYLFPCAIVHHLWMSLTLPRTTLNMIFP